MGVLVRMVWMQALQRWLRHAWRLSMHMLTNILMHSIALCSIVAGVRTYMHVYMRVHVCTCVPAVGAVVYTMAYVAMTPVCGCLICGGRHFARRCPQKKGGKGKGGYGTSNKGHSGKGIRRLRQGQVRQRQRQVRTRMSDSPSSRAITQSFSMVSCLRTTIQ